MPRLRHQLYILVIILLCSCKNDSGYTYAIKDFRQSLQPLFTKIVSKGIVTYYDSSFRQMVTDKELIQLSKSEHPVLRATAFREMLQRKSFNHFDVLMSHLDDTATVATNAGEFGIWYRTVSDDILLEANWKSNEDKSKTINEVITKHNYLKSAYIILEQIEPQKKYYPFIKDMATRKRNYDEELGEQGFGDVEYALYGLAKFKKKDDIEIIREQLLTNYWKMSNLSFTLMNEFPDTSYLQVFEKYYRYYFYRTICVDHSVDKAVDFINSIATYKNERSANILGLILNRKPFVKCSVDTSFMKYQLAYAIWNNECTAYLKLRKQIEYLISKEEKHTNDSLQIEPYVLPIDSSGENIGWLK